MVQVLFTRYKSKKNNLSFKKKKKFRKSRIHDILNFSPSKRQHAIHRIFHKYRVEWTVHR